MIYLLKFSKLVLVILIILFLGNLILAKSFPSASQIKFGVTFSPRYAKYLNLDYQKIYLQILDELKVRNLRLPSYWDILEPEEKKYDFSETDFMLAEANKRGARVILVVGARQPRWPECHVPDWAKSLTLQQRQQATLGFIQKVIERYQGNPSIWAYQVENEPFAYWFGENCDSPDANFLQQEVMLTKKLDSKKPVIITDSGEWGTWVKPLKFSDILGISVYKVVYNSTLNNYVNYPFTPWMYDIKSAVLKGLFAPQNQKTIIAELQTEAWLSDQDSEAGLPAREHQLYPVESFKNNVEFAKNTNFDEAYLWGVEWWYFMAAHGYPEYLDYAKNIFK